MAPLKILSEIRGVKFIWEKIRGLKIYSEKVRGLKILGLSELNTPGGYSPLKMTAPLGILGSFLKTFFHFKHPHYIMLFRTGNVFRTGNAFRIGYLVTEEKLWLGLSQ